MKKVIFRDQNGDDLFVSMDLEGFILPRENETIICLKLVMTVTSVTHNYDAKEIIVNVTLS